MNHRDDTGILRAIDVLAPGLQSLAPSTSHAPDGSPGTALVLTPKVQMSIRLEYLLARLVADKYPVTGRTPHDRDRRMRERIREIRRRIYREPGTTSPKIFQIQYEPTRYDLNVAPKASLVIQDNNGHPRTVTVRPEFELGIGFERIRQVGDRWQSNGVYHVILIAPDGGRRDNEGTAVEIGLAPLSELEEFNRLSQADPIPSLPHALERLGQRRMIWTPQTCEPRRYGEGADAETKIFLGYMGSVLMFLDPKSDMLEYVPGKPDEDGRPTFQKGKPTVVSYVLTGPRSAMVKRLGRPGEVEIEDGNVPTLEGAEHFDPWTALGRTPARIDFRNLTGLRDRLVETVSNPENPAVVYGRRLGIIRERDDLASIALHAGQIVDRAVNLAREEGERAWQQLVAQIDEKLANLTPEEAYDGANPRVVRARRKGDNDVVAQRIAEAIGSPFDWGSPTHRQLRERVLDRLDEPERRP